MNLLVDSEKMPWEEELDSAIKQQVETIEVPPFATWKEKLNKPKISVPWVVDKMFISGGATMIVGEGGLGKSWFASHIAACVAGKGLVHGEFQVSRHGNVLWYDNENGTLENDRRTQLLLDERFKESEFDVLMREVPDHYFTADEEGLKKLHDDIVVTKPSLVIIDSMISTFYGEMTENNANDVRTIIDGILKTTGGIEHPPAFLFLHHTKKGTEGEDWTGFRGSSDFQNAVSFLITMRSRREDDKRFVQFRWDKSRVGNPPDGVFEYSLRDVNEKVVYTPSAHPVSPTDEMTVIIKDVLRKEGEPVIDSELPDLISERYRNPPSKPFIKFVLYNLSTDPKSGVSRYIEPTYNKDGEIAKKKLFYKLK